MGGRNLLADATALGIAAARRLGLSTRADRQERLHCERRLPAPRAVEPVEGVLPVRVLLLGNGPAESPGLHDGEADFAQCLSDALADRLGRPVRVTTVLGGDWDLDLLAARLRAEQLHWHDALVVTAAYRPGLAEIPIARWRDYAQRLRTTLTDAAGPDTAIRVLSLPWRSAVRDAPHQWGGAFGCRVVAMAETAEATLRGQGHAVPLRLADPVGASEWVGPSFSQTTYRRWAEQVAADLAPVLLTGAAAD